MRSDKADRDLGRADHKDLYCLSGQDCIMVENEYKSMNELIKEIKQFKEFNDVLIDENEKLKQNLIKDSEHVHILIEEIKQLKEKRDMFERSYKVCEMEHIELTTERLKLREIISKIEDVAYDWDGRDSCHYGNKIMALIHSDWKRVK